MINPACEVDAGHYKDNFNGVYAIDHVTLQTTEDPSVVADDSGDLELYRSALQRALQAYVSSKFRCELTAGTVAMKDGKLHAYIYAIFGVENGPQAGLSQWTVIRAVLVEISR